MKGLCRTLYDKDVASSTVALVPSCLEKCLNPSVNCKSRTAVLRWVTTWDLAVCQPVPLVVHLHP